MQKLVVLFVTATLFAYAPPSLADEWRGDHDNLGRKHGVWQLYADDGELVLESLEYRHDVQNGLAMYYYASGNLSGETDYVNGVRQGNNTTYFDDAETRKSDEGQFKNNLKTGEWQSWHSNGQLQSTTSFFNGHEDGLRIIYFASGQEEKGPVSEEANYKRGVLDGEYISYYDSADHNIKAIGEHKNNLRSGFWVEYFATGEQKSMIEYVAGAMHGDVLLGHNSEQLAVETTYSNNQLHGEYTAYFDNRAHTKQFQGAHKNGKRDGKWTEWYANGNMASETRYILGRLNGPASYYQEYDGSLKFITEYQDDAHHGAYITYHFPKPLQPATSDDQTPQLDDTNYRLEFGRHELGRRVGEWFWLHGNGETMTQGSYFEGQQFGTWRFFTENGALSRVLEFSDGQLVSEKNDCHLATVNCED